MSTDASMSGALGIDESLQKAEELWRNNHKDAALPHYDAALALARKTAPEKVEQILVGKGFALLNAVDAEVRLTRSARWRQMYRI